jgi:hypothetical protein
VFLCLAGNARIVSIAKARQFYTPTHLKIQCFSNDFYEGNQSIIVFDEILANLQVLVDAKPPTKTARTLLKDVGNMNNVLVHFSLVFLDFSSKNFRVYFSFVDNFLRTALHKRDSQLHFKNLFFYQIYS